MQLCGSNKNNNDENFVIPSNIKNPSVYTWWKFINWHIERALSLDVITRTEKNLSSQLVYLKRSFVLCYMKANTCLDKKYLAVWWCYFLSFVLQLQFYLVSQTSPLGIVELFIICGETEKFLNSYLKA